MPTLTKKVHAEALCFQLNLCVIYQDHFKWEYVGPVSNRYHVYHALSLRKKYLLVSSLLGGHLLASFLPEGLYS
jgi:hypothetical protein